MSHLISSTQQDCSSGFPSLSCDPETSSRQKGKVAMGVPLCFFHLLRIIVLHCLLSNALKQPIFLSILSSFIAAYDRWTNSVAVTPFWPGEEVVLLDTCFHFVL